MRDEPSILTMSTKPKVMDSLSVRLMMGSRLATTKTGNDGTGCARVNVGRIAGPMHHGSGADVTAANATNS